MEWLGALGALDQSDQSAGVVMACQGRVARLVLRGRNFSHQVHLGAWCGLDYGRLFCRPDCRQIGGLLLEEATHGTYVLTSSASASSSIVVGRRRCSCRVIIVVLAKVIAL